MSFVDGGQTGGRFVLELVVALYKRDSYAPNVTTKRTLLLWLTKKRAALSIEKKRNGWRTKRRKKWETSTLLLSNR